MNKQDYENSLVRQSRQLVGCAAHITESIERQVGSVLSPEEIAGTAKAIIVGCGDSWMAGLAAKVAFEGVARIETDAMRCVDFSRNYSAKLLGPSVLVIGVSVSGSVSRVAEALQRANFYGANTLAVTANESSLLAKSAKHVLRVDLPPDLERGPGANNYVGSLIGLAQLALHMAKERNHISPSECDAMRGSIVDYIAETARHLEAYEDLAFDTAQRWAKLKAYDFIGDYGDYATAFFGSAKILETFGGYTTYDDSEDWNHINYYLAEPERIGRVVVANAESPSFSRLRENIGLIGILKSPCVVVGNCDESVIPPGFVLFKTPAAKYLWLYPFVQHIPLGLVAGYIARIRGENNATQDVPAFIQNPDVADATRIRASEIKIV